MPILDRGKMDHLLKVYAERPSRIAFFAGAGLSRPLFPTWQQLLRLMIDRASKLGMLVHNARELKDLLASGQSYLDIADACRRALGPSAYRGFLEEQFQTNIQQVQLPAAYSRLFALKPQLILTTNYDKLPELAAKGTYSVFTNRHSPEALRAFERGDPTIYKLHGDINDSASIVLTRSDYQDAIYGASAAEALLRAVLSTRTLLFLGFGLTDPHLELTLDWIFHLSQRAPIQHFVLLDEQSLFKAQSIETRWGVSVIRYEPSAPDHPEVAELLSSLAGAAHGPPAPPATIPESLRCHLLNTGHDSVLIHRPVPAHLHVSVVSRAQTERELQQEVLAILRGCAGIASGIEEVAIFLHARTPVTPDYAHFEPVILACRVRLDDVLAFSSGKTAAQNFWRSVQFFRLEGLGTGHDQVLPFPFSFIGIE